jgi:HEAT repeat protein
MSDERLRLTALAGSSDSDERRAALTTLAACPEPWAVNLLRGLLKDPLPAIRAASVHALAERAAILTQPTTDALVATVERDPDSETRRAAVQVLGRMLSVPTAPRRHVIRRVLRSVVNDPVLRSVAQAALKEGPQEPAARESQRKASARQLLERGEPSD